MASSLPPPSPFTTHTSKMSDLLRLRLLRSKVIFIPSAIIILYILFHIYNAPSPEISNANGSKSWKSNLPSEIVTDKSPLPNIDGSDEEQEGVGGKLSLGPKKPIIDLTKLALEHDNPPNADQIVLVVKTGGQVVWDKLPIHMTTTFTRAPNYLIYSDRADMVGRVQVHDVFYHMDPETIKTNNDFEIYRSMVELKKNPQFLLAKEVKADGGWKLDKYKNVPMLIDAWNRIPDKDWYVFIDDDTGMFWGSLVRYLDALDHTVPLYIGSQTLFRGELFAHGGSGYIVSRAAMLKAIERNTEAEIIREFELVAEKSCCGDHVVARLLQATGTNLTWAGTKFNGRPWWERKFNRGVWCEEVMTYHHLGPEQVQEMFEFDLLMEQRFREGYYSKYPQRKKKHMGKKDYVLHLDVYQYFIEPTLKRVAPRIAQWDNMCDDESVTGEVTLKEQGLRQDATANADACEQACKDRENCMQWRFTPGKCDINTKGFIMGRAASEKEKKGKMKDYASGWMVERIEKDLKEGKCLIEAS